MIPGFSKIIQHDFESIRQYINNGCRSDKQTEKKVAIAAIRMLAVFGMTLAAFSVFPAFTATTGGQALSRLMGAVAMYVLNRDIFILAVNQQKKPASQLVAFSRAVVGNVRDTLEQKEGLAPRHYLTEDTLLRPVWDVVVDLINRD